VGEAIWVAELLISDRTAEKIRTKHGIEPQEVKDEVQCARLRCTWDTDQERGERALVEAFIRGRRTLAVLYPAGHPASDVWHLGSIYFI